MSLQFSNTSTKNGIIQRIEKTVGFQDGGISGDSTLLAQFTGDVNEALNRALTIIFNVGGTWQFDDSNHTDLPIITTNLVTGQRDYPFTTDGSSNLILEIEKVLVADENGLFREITPVDIANAPTNMWDGQDTGGQPNTYDKLGNGILLDPIPNYNATGGLKLYISREGSYFATSDTTKKPGIAGLFHEYLVLYPALQYSVRNALAITKNISAMVDKMEEDMREFYLKREEDVRKVIRPIINNSH